jgi:colanic acid/amylovoran biosynthesis glycosyltransferase
LDQLAFRRRIRIVLRSWRPDVVHIHYGTTAASLISVQELFRVRTIVSFYGFDISQALREPRFKAAYRKLVAKVSLVHVLCDAARERVIALGCVPNRILVENLHIDVLRYAALPTSQLTSVRRWLLPARFVAKKGHVVALRAFSEVRKCEPDARLTFFGYGDRTWLNALVSEMDLEAHVTIIDTTVAIDFDLAYERVLEETDAVLTPSISSASGDDEGGPALTAVMAQAAGKPVIFSDFPGSERTLTDGVEGFLVPQGDPIALAEAMLRMARQPGAASVAMGEAGRRRVVPAFSRVALREVLLVWYGVVR